MIYHHLGMVTDHQPICHYQRIMTDKFLIRIFKSALFAQDRNQSQALGPRLWVESQPPPQKKWITSTEELWRRHTSQVGGFLTSRQWLQRARTLVLMWLQRAGTLVLKWLQRAGMSVPKWQQAEQSRTRKCMVKCLTARPPIAH